jgi:hypothetical protein
MSGNPNYRRAKWFASAAACFGFIIGGLTAIDGYKKTTRGGSYSDATLPSGTKKEASSPSSGETRTVPDQGERVPGPTARDQGERVPGPTTRDQGERVPGPKVAPSISTADYALFVSTGGFLVSLVGTASTMILGWRTDRRQQRELAQKLAARLNYDS